MSYIDNQIVELRRQVERLRAETPAIYSVEPKNPTTSSILIDTSNNQTKYWDGKNWIITGGSLMNWNTSVLFTASDYRTINWSSGVMSVGTTTSKVDYAISSGSFQMSDTTYFYWQDDIPTAIQTTTTPGNAVIGGGIIVAVCQLNPDTSNNASIKTFGGGSTDLIISSNIVANSITSNMLQANSITSAKLATTLLYAGAITLDTNGTIKGGQTAYNTGNGFFLGWDSSGGGSYKFSIGDPDGEYLYWDGEHLTINGSISLAGTLAWSQITNDGNAPANNATVNATFYQDSIPTSLAIGDIWIDSNDGNKVYRAAIAGADEIASGEWEIFSRQVFTAEPTTPYFVGDLWLTSLTESAGDFKKCTTERLTGAYNAGDWLIATKYTDDTTANLAQGRLDDMASDGKITPVEKLTAKQIWDNIVVEGTATTGTIPAQAISLGVSHTNFDNAYSALNTYLNTTLAVFSDMTATTNITRTTWDTKWNDYWNQRTLIISAIETKASELATWSYISGIPTTLTAPSGSGLFLSSTNMGYYAGGTWTTYIDNSGNFLLGDITGVNSGLYWNQGTGILTIKGAINITNTIPAGSISGLASTATSSDFSAITGVTKPADNATVGANWNSNLSNIPSTLGTPSGSGLFLSSTNMGYYTGGAWKTYFDNSGNMILGDIAGGNAGISWNQGTATLTIKGTITATTGTIGSFTIGTYLYTGSKTAYNDTNSGIHIGSDGIGIGNNVFTVSSTGAVVCTSATITGALTTGIGSSINGTYLGTGTVTYDKLSVTTLSAITANLGTITAGTLTGTLLRTSSSGERIEINDSTNTCIFYNSSNANILQLGYGGTVKTPLIIEVPADGNSYASFSVQSSRTNGVMSVFNAKASASGYSSTLYVTACNDVTSPTIYYDRVAGYFLNSTTTKPAIYASNLSSGRGIEVNSATGNAGYLSAGGSSETLYISNSSTGRGITISTSTGTGLYFSGTNANAMIAVTTSPTGPILDLTNNSGSGGSTSSVNGIYVKTYNTCYSGAFVNYGGGGAGYFSNSSSSNSTMYITNGDSSANRPSLTVANGITSLSGKLKIPVGSNLY